MLSIRILAAFLLILRVGSDIYIGLILRRQRKLGKIQSSPAVKKGRKRLFAFASIIFLGNMIPIVIDTLTIFVDLGRTPNVKPLSVGYALSNAIVAFLSAYIIHSLYKLAATEFDIRERSKK